MAAEKSVPEKVLRTGPMSAFLTDESSISIARECFKQLDCAEAHVEHGDVRTAVEDLADRHSPQVLIVDISGVAEPLAQIHRLADACDPSTSVLVVGDRNDVVLYREIKSLGVFEYLFKPITLDLLVRSCRMAISGETEGPTEAPIGKLITMIGVRGGVGSTTLGVNLVWHLARKMGRDVALLDLDLQSGDTAGQLNVQPTLALRTALANAERIDAIFVERAAIKVTPKLQLFATLEPVGEALVPDEKAILHLVANLRQHHRYVFVDAPIGAGFRLDLLTASSSTVILVAEPTIIAAREMVRWEQKLKAAPGAGTVYRVLNKAGMPGALSAGDFAVAIAGKPDIVVPYAPEVVQGVNGGEPAIETSRTVRTALAPLFRHLSGDAEAEPASLFARIFGK